jgi:hypothetical protein
MRTKGSADVLGARRRRAGGDDLERRRSRRRTAPRWVAEHRLRAGVAHFLAQQLATNAGENLGVQASRSGPGQLGFQRWAVGPQNRELGEILDVSALERRLREP